MIKLKSYTAKTHQGPYLQINEDDLDIDLLKKLYVIFDGFGGSGIGDKVVQASKDNIKKFYGRISEDINSTMPFFYSSKYLVEGNSLINSLHYAHTHLKKESAGKSLNELGGTSVVGVAQSENILTFASIGNCMALLYRRGKLEKITQPDCVDILADDPFKKPFYSSPLSGLGLFDDIQIEIKELKIKEGDVVILLTDGVYSRLSLNEIRYIVQNPEISDNEKIKELFDVSNSRGNLDNQTTIFLKY